MIEPKASRDSSSAGRQERTQYERSCAACSPARQSVVLPMPTAPSRRRLPGPPAIPATKSRMAASSVSRPTTLAGGASSARDICRVSRRSYGLGRSSRLRVDVESEARLNLFGTSVPRCEMATEPGTQAIDRAAELLVRVLESGRPLAVGELAARSGLPKSTTSRLVGALERRGLVQRSVDRGRLSPGPVLLRFAHHDGGQSLVELAAPVLERLAAETRETINLAVPGPLGAEHLDQRDSEHLVGVPNWVGRRCPRHVAANGKVFMAFGAAPIPRRLERFTERTIINRARLEGELERVRARGYATAVDELELGL